MKRAISPLQALVWIVGSLLLIPGGTYKLTRTVQNYRPHVDWMARIIQTGPQREVLQTSYLAGLMDLSADRPLPARKFDPSQAQKGVEASPVIKKAVVQFLAPDTVYVDYTVYQPVAFLFDFPNVAIDEEGVPFPLLPFFSPKVLPELYLGIDKVAWHTPVQGERAFLGLTLMKLLTQLPLKVKRVDVAHVDAPRLAQREIIVILEEEGALKYLRLSPKNYPKELGNYLEMRRDLPPVPQVIDLRLDRLAFLRDL
jgi:hypothetical protein